MSFILHLTITLPTYTDTETIIRKYIVYNVGQLPNQAFQILLVH